MSTIPNAPFNPQVTAAINALIDAKIVTEQAFETATLSDLRAGTATNKLTNTKNFKDNGETRSAATVLALAGGTTRQLLLTNTGTQDGLNIAGATAGNGILISGSTASAINISGASANVIVSTSAITGNFIKFTGTVGTAADGTLFSTGSTWIAHATAGQCAFKILASTTATSGDYGTMRIRARADAADAAAGRGTMGIVAGNFSASSSVNNHGNLIALQGYSQPNAFTNDGSANICCGVYSCIDRTSGGTSVGRDWSLWTDTHMQVKASGGSYMHRISHNGTVANDGCWTIYNGGRIPQLITFEDVAGFLTVSGGGETFTKTHKLACKILGDSTQYYLQLGTV